MLRVIEKDPAASKVYGLDFKDPAAEDGPFLEDGEELVSATWNVTPAGLTAQGLGHDGRYAPVRLTGGAQGQSYRLACDFSWTDLDGETQNDRRSIRVDVQQQ